MKSAWKKSPEALVRRFDEAVAGLKVRERRQMFG
jgi:hypothetical protein